MGSPTDGTPQGCDSERTAGGYGGATNGGGFLHDQKKSTTPGMSNVSYGNIKDWPEELITHCYQLLSVMWRQEHIPQAWKEKWAVLLAKTVDTADINNLRPIRLEDCAETLV